jgi:hypothetical protein
MDTLADYNAWKDKQQQTNVEAANVVIGGVDGRPDEVAGDLNLANDFAKTTGNPIPPAPMVKEFRGVFQQAVEREKNRAILSSAPRLTEWMRNPENAAVAKDDLHNLSWWENMAIVPRGIASAIPAFNEGAWGAAASLAALPGRNRLSDYFESLARTSRAMKGDVAGPTGGSWLGEMVQGASQSLGLAAPGVLATISSGGATIPGVVASYLIPGAVTQGGTSAVKALEAGKSPIQAFQYGLQDAAAEAIFERLPVGKLVGDIAQGTGFGKMLMHQLATEIPTEVATTLYQNLNEYANLTPQKAFSEFLAAQPAAIRDTIAQTALASLGLSSAAAGGRHFLERTAKAQAAEDRKTVFEAISGNAQASALRNRLPDKFRQFVETATANGPVENVYVPADQFVQYFQSIGTDPHAIVDQLEGVTRDDLDAALAGGGDLQIPTATYAAKIAGSEHDAFLMENMRFDPDQFTAREAAEFNAHAQDAMQEAYDEAERVRQEDEQYRSHEQEIYDTMVSRLREAGRSTDVATTEATLYPAFYRVMAERSGMTIDEFMQKYPLPQVRGDLPEGIQYKNVDDLNRTLAEARSRKAAPDDRQTLLEFIDQNGGINDVGGELKARDAEVVKRGKGKNNLKLARSGVVSAARDLFGGSGGKKHSADEVARAAIEAGFMADDPVVHEYQEAVREGREVPDITRTLWDHIDRELQGRPQYSANEPAAPAVARNAELDRLVHHLADIGVSLNDSDEAIRKAIEASQPGKTYGQPGERTVRRGSIQIPSAGVGNGETIIRLFETANLSTFVHESGHYFLTVMQDMARTDARAATDYTTVRAWWLENAAAVAKDANKSGVAVTSDDVRAAYEKGTTGDAAKDAAIDVGAQEQFARAFEAYLMEGKAPSAELRTAFEKFRAWLIAVYRRLTSLNVKPSTELRGVFDRMIATDDEIARADAETGDAGPVFASAAQMGLTDEQYAAFLKLRDQAQEDAKARLLRETMAPIKRQQEKWFKEERKAVFDEVERAVNAYPVYRAFEWMGNRRWLGDLPPETISDIRLSRGDLVAIYGEGVLKTLPRGKQAIYVNEGGVHPDDAAAMFGFSSGDEMIKALEKAPKRTDAINAETDRVMRERHGDALNDGQIEQHALEAVHSADKRGEWIAAELKAVVDVAGTGNVMTVKEAKAIARVTISRMRVRDAVNSGRYLAAERKAADEAARLGATLAREKLWLDAARRKVGTAARAALRGEGSVDAVAKAVDANNAKFETTTTNYTATDREVTGKGGQTQIIKGGERTVTNLGYNELVTKLIEAKRRQLLNHALYSEASKAADEVARAERYVDRLSGQSSRDAIAGAGRRENAQFDYLSAIDDILERYDFRRLSAGQESRRGALTAFVTGMIAAGRENELAIPDSVMREALSKPYKTVPLEELRGVVDSLKNLEHVAKRWNDLVDATNQRNFNATLDAIADGIDKHLPKRPPGRVRTKAEQLRNLASSYLNSVLNATTILREIDGFKDQGAAYQAMKAPIDEAQNRLIVRKQDAAKALEELYSVYSKEERRAMATRMFLPELGQSLSKWELIALGLNTGNEGNRSRLTKQSGDINPHKYTDDQINYVLANRLTAKDADFIQSVWDYIGAFKADIAARERRVTGVEPEWVDAAPVTIGGKQLAGGYYPIKYDARLSSITADRETLDIASALIAGKFGKAQTKNGHTKERMAVGVGPVSLDMAVLHKHVNQVIYDLELSEPVANAWRLLQNGRVRGGLEYAGRSADFDALQSWLKDAAEGELGATTAIGSAMMALRSNFTAAKLGLNLTNALQQMSGVAQSFVVVGKKDMAVGIAKTMRDPAGAAGAAVIKSPFMATRQTTFNKDMNAFLESSASGATPSRWKEFKKDYWGPSAFWLMQKVQWHFADVPTWVAGYEQGLRKFGGDEERAVAHADDMVKRAQGSSLFTDRSAIERGSLGATTRQNEFVKLFSTLGSYMFAKANVAYERGKIAQQVFAENGASQASVLEAASLVTDMVMLFSIEALVGAAASAAAGAAFGSGDDGGDDENPALWLAKKAALSVIGTLPFVRDMASVAQGYGAGGAYGSITGDLAKPIWTIGKAVGAVNSEFSRSDAKALSNALGASTGFPSVMSNRVIDALARQSNGEQVSPFEFAFGKFGKGK